MVTKTHMDVGYYGRVRNYFREVAVIRGSHLAVVLARDSRITPAQLKS